VANASSGAGSQNWRALLIEIGLTLLLVSVILSTASTALRVGGYIALADLWGGTGKRRLDEPGPLVRPGPGQPGRPERWARNKPTPADIADADAPQGGQ
jgi:hypothetical protein